MRKALFMLLAIMLFASGCAPQKSDDLPVETEAVPEVTAAPIVEEEDPPLIKNSTFDNDISYWSIYNEGTASTVKIYEGQLLVPITSVGRVEYANQVFTDGVPISKGCTYKLTFDIGSNIDRACQVRIQKNGAPYTGYLEEDFDILKDEMTHFEYEFTMESETDTMSRLVFNLGFYEGLREAGMHQVFLDNVFLELTAGEPEQLDLDIELSSIRINQLGYRTDDTKVAAFVDIKTNISTFDVVGSDGNVVGTFDLSSPVTNKNSKEDIRLGDFSSIKDGGTYTIKVGNKESRPFEIGDDVYKKLTDDIFLMLYYQRCGTDLDEEICGEYAHAACHLEEAIIYGTDETIDVSGGWHDAGDYGRYITPGAIAVADLLNVYSDFPEKCTDDIGIPESGNGVPDVLDEARYELEWMLKMQTSDGGVYHKVTTAKFVGTEYPEENTEDLIVSPVSPTATGAFSAVMAKASRAYMGIDSEFADKCLQASINAYKWLEANPKAAGFDNPEEISTGEYGDSNFGDEWFWAATELYLATEDEAYHSILKERKVQKGLGWINSGSYGALAYLSAPEYMQDADVVAKIMASLETDITELLEFSAEDMYSVALDKDGYVWGSNANVASNARMFMLDEANIETAKHSWTIYWAEMQ